MQKSKEKLQKERKQIYNEIVEAFGVKYSWLGAQAAREMLMSVASWNIQKHSEPPFRYRTHVMLAWKRGYLKSTMMRVMADILGDDNTSTIGKVSDAAMRGSVSGKSFTPPKPLRSPIVISTEFGQTDFNDELLNLFLNQLEEGETNVALNKIAQLSENQREDIQQTYDNRIRFRENNEFDLKCDFVFWGATYDPTKLADDALRSRFNVVTPVKPLNHEITRAADNNPGVKRQIDKTTVKDVRRFIKQDKEFPTDFRPPHSMYKEFDLNPRESRDVQSYMACRNWWGLDTNPDVMRKYIEYLKQSRRLSTMKPEERVFELIFDTPRTYKELMEETGLGKKELFKIMRRLDAQKHDLANETKWVIWSGGGEEEKDEEDNFLSAYT